MTVFLNALSARKKNNIIKLVTNNTILLGGQYIVKDGSFKIGCRGKGFLKIVYVEKGGFQI